MLIFLPYAKLSDMENYYDEILDEIAGLLRNGKAQDAAYLIRKELEMPYIPREAEKKLHEMEREVRYRLAENKEKGEEPLSSLLSRLKSKPQSQLLAAEKLSGRNLRDCLAEIRDWLAKDPQPEAAALMIEALAMQNIDEEFVLRRNGLEYTFYSGDVVPVAKQPAYLAADALLKEWFVHNPDYYEMAHTLLIHELYLFLPLMYEESEAADLAREMGHRVADLMDDQEAGAEIDAAYRARS